MKYYWLRIKDYLSIMSLLAFHIRHRWNLQNLQMYLILDIFLLSIIIPIFIVNFGNYDFLYILETSVLQAIVLSCVLFGLVLKKSDLTLRNFKYECTYIKNLGKFLLHAYQNSLKAHLQFLNSYHLMQKYNLYKERDHFIMRQVFFSVFKLYFLTMYQKNKKSDPYLIDTQELSALYQDPQFLEFYTKIFFNSPSKTNNKYEHLLIYILDTVLMNLYKEKWFIQYYDEFILFKFIDFMLRIWYDNILKYNLQNIKNFDLA